MSWLVAAVLALAAFAAAVAIFRLPRATWTTLLAALVFGLAGYALQANPDIDSSPKSDSATAYEDEWQVVESRKLLVGGALESPSNHLLTSDAFARRGQFSEAAGFLGNVVGQDPEDFEAWVALGNALTEQSDGVLTQAAIYAYTRANEIAPDNPAPSYFLGLSLLRQGRMLEARQVWASALAQMGEEESEARAFMMDRVQRLDELLVRLGAQAQQPTQEQGAGE